MSEKTVRPEPTQVDWVRLAAFIDGEGNIDIYESTTTIRGKKYRGFYLRVSVFNTDPRLSIWCERAFGGKIHARRSQRKHWRPCFVWTCGSNLSARVLRGCAEYFLLKTEQANVALAFLATMGKRGTRVPEEVVDKRRKLKNELSSLKWQPRELEVDSRIVQ